MTPSQRIGHPFGINSQQVPIRGNRKTDKGFGKILPNNARGVTRKLTKGMAIALASGPISDTCPNNNIVNGTNPTVTAYCVRPAIRTSRLKFCARPSANGCNRPPAAKIITATAPNDSQKPGDSTAQGSRETTNTSASDSTVEKLLRRPVHSASATTSCIYIVRCEGTPNPASATYSNAVIAPANAAIFCTGTYSGKSQDAKKERRHKNATRPENNPATIVMCRPEMLMR